jgi:hypothetical protein
MEQEEEKVNLEEDHTTQYRETTKEDWARTIIYLSLFVAVIVTGAIFLMPVYWHIWLVLVAGSLFLLVGWHKKTSTYRCPKCGHEFEVSALTDLISPHGIDKSEAGARYGWKYLKCPKCHERSKAIVMTKENR